MINLWLKGSDCDMGRPHAKGSMPSAKSEGDPEYVTPYTRMFRFSFGPLLPETFESDIKLFRQVYEEYKKDMGVWNIFFVYKVVLNNKDFLPLAILTG